MFAGSNNVSSRRDWLKLGLDVVAFGVTIYFMYSYAGSIFNILGADKEAETRAKKSLALKLKRPEIELMVLNAHEGLSNIQFIQPIYLNVIIYPKYISYVGCRCSKWR